MGLLNGEGKVKASVIVTVGGIAAAVVSIITAANYLQNYIPATAADLERVENDSLKRDEKIVETLQTIQTEQQDMRKDQNALMRSFWEQKKREALDELKINPNSRTATRQLEDAEAAIRKLNRQERDQ